jgi:large subunit ribosomal protein L15
MRLNTLKPGAGAKRARLRVGRGASAGQGKTCGRGVKGQRARKGGYHKVGFEGGQTTIDRRLPKFGFRSKIKATRAEVRLNELEKVASGVVDLDALKAAGLVPMFTERVKVILSGKIKTAVTLKGVAATKGARSKPWADASKAKAWQLLHSTIRLHPWGMWRATERSAAACCSWSGRSSCFA